MVEGPKIRIVYEKVKHIKWKKILKAYGSSYLKMNIDLIGYIIRKIWYVGKYIYIFLKNNDDQYVIRTHMLMFGKILLDKIFKSKPQMVWELDNGDIISWYASQVTLLDPSCSDDKIKSNYTICSSKESIKQSIQMMKYDIFNKKFDRSQMIKHIYKSFDKIKDDCLTDLLLNQEFFPGVGNILQQEALYRCRILPFTLVKDIDKSVINCLIDELLDLSNLLYNAYFENIRYGSILQIYHKAKCPLGHKTKTQYVGYHERRTTWCPVCQK